MSDGGGCGNKTGKPDPDLCSKYCAEPEHHFEVPCADCREPVLVCYGSLEVIGPYHDGCFGWPACACTVRHKGDCTEETRAARYEEKR